MDAPDPAPLLELARAALRRRAVRRSDPADGRGTAAPAGLHRAARACAARRLSSPPRRACARSRAAPSRRVRCASSGSPPDLPAAKPTTAGVIETLRALDLRGRRVGVQLYGDEPNRALIDFLESAGATALPVAPYRYADGAAAVAWRVARAHARRRDRCHRLHQQGPGGAAVSRCARPRGARSACRRPMWPPSVRWSPRRWRRTASPSQTMPKAAWFMKPLTAALSALLEAGRASEPTPPSS